VAQADLAVVVRDRARYLLFGVKCYFTKNKIAVNHLRVAPLKTQELGFMELRAIAGI
jgi:hypothetical protein